MGFKIVAKLGPKELGDPTRVREKSFPEGQTLVLGTIFGVASGLSYRANDNDPTKPSIALTGVFEGVPVEGDDTIRSTVLFLPGTVQEILVNAIRGDSPAPISEAPKRGAKMDVSGNTLNVAVEVGVKKANNAVGYAYDIRIAGEPAKDNVLDAMRAQVLGADRRLTGAPQLAAPTAGGKTTPAKTPAKRPKKR